jgi:hypothetical protein
MVRLPSLALAVQFVAASGQAQDIWFVPKSGRAPVADFMALFEPDAPWKSAASHVAVFGMGLPPPKTPGADEKLTQIFADLRRRNIGLSITLAPLSSTHPTADGQRCGYHVEGYGAETGPLHDAQWIKSLGGEPQYFEMDEPLYFGHVYTGPNACSSTIDEIVDDVAKQVRRIKSIFPNAKIGDGEPAGFPSETWLDDVENFITKFHAVTGQDLAFFRLDVGWGYAWRDKVQALSRVLRRHGIPLQVIYNGSGRDKTGQEWIEHAIEHAKEFERIVVPDAVSIQCWTTYPDHLLPETDRSALTSLINRYVEWKKGSIP